jgi:hypothetical protein
MRSPLLLSLLLCCVHAPLLAHELKIVRTWPGYRTAETFSRVSEYFTGRENTGGQTYLRSQPAQREGYYFLLRVKNGSDALTSASLELNLITARSPEPVTYRYPVAVPAGQHVFQVGLTGSDWPNPEETPVAWQLVIRDAEGAVLVSDQSFLWSKPDRT